MTASKYIRPMSFGELMSSALHIYVMTIWPLWLLITLIFVILDLIYMQYWDNASTPHEIQDLLLLGFILLPVFFVGPAMLTISNVVLTRPKKTLKSFMKGMSPGIILKIFLFLSPLVILSLGLRTYFFSGF